MATVPHPSTALPTSGDEILAAQLTDWVNAIIDFLETTNLDEANVDLTNTDGLVGKSTAQTIAGWKTFTKASITELASCPYSTDTLLGGVRVTADEAITAGNLVYVSSWDATNGRLGVKKAVSATTNAATFYADYYSPNAITSGAAGTVYRMGMLTTIDTSGLIAGRPVFLSTTAGGWTGSLPAAASEYRIQVVGKVVTVHGSTGRIALKLPGQVVPWSIADQV